MPIVATAVAYFLQSCAQLSLQWQASNTIGRPGLYRIFVDVAVARNMQFAIAFSFHIGLLYMYS